MRPIIVKPLEFFEHWYKCYPVGTTRTKDMLRDVFMLGYNRAGTDAVNLVGDWACSVAGCAAELHKPEDLYDGVQLDLTRFFEEMTNEKNP